jgi:hypothetical protein
MESEKTIYWMTLGVLAMAAVTGFVSEHRGWSDRLADRSIAVLSQASKQARNYAGVAGMLWGSSEADAVRPAQLEAAFQNELRDEIQSEVDSHMACAQRVIAHHQAELARVQAMNMKVQVRMVKHSPRTIVWPARNMVIEIPQTL